MKTKIKHVEELFSSKDDFEKAVFLTKNFLNDKVISVRFPFPDRVLIRIDEQKLKLDESLNFEDFKNILQNEIAKYLESLLFSAPKEFSTRYINNDFIPLEQQDVPKPEEIWEFVEPRIEYVKKHLFNSLYRECNIIKKTSKVSYLENINWSISIRKHDIDEGDLGNIPYCSIRFSFRKPITNFTGKSISTEMFFSNLISTQPTEISSDFHLKDIEDLIEDLQTIKKNLLNLSNEDE